MALLASLGFSWHVRKYKRADPGEPARPKGPGRGRPPKDASGLAMEWSAERGAWVSTTDANETRARLDKPRRPKKRAREDGEEHGTAPEEDDPTPEPTDTSDGA